MKRSLTLLEVACLAFLLLVLVGWTPPSQAAPLDGKALLPLLNFNPPGWKLKEGLPKVKKGTENDKPWVEAQATFTAGARRLEAAIKAGGNVPQDLAAWEGIEDRDNERGFQRKVTIKGFKALEFYDKQKKRGAVFINVAGQFGVVVGGEGLDNIQAVKEVINKIDLHKLATLAK
jgi:hypothetical protein